MTETWCCRCHQWLEAERFRPDPETRSGPHTYCRLCAAEIVHQWRERNADYVAAYNAARRVEKTKHVCALVECRSEFTGRADAKFCSRRCRDRNRYLRRKDLAR